MPEVKPRKKILVALSGGVDSSVCAALLCDEGYEVVGVTCVFCDDPETGIHVPGSSAIARARSIADRLGIEYHVVDAQRDFTEHVLKPFAHQYAQGLTPNPCAICNPSAKFKTLFDAVDMFGCDMLATGHYAFVDTRGNLVRGSSSEKDQSYFLYRVDPMVLGRILFPLASLTKSEVRAIARAKGLESADTPESQDVCFAGADGSGYKRVIEQYAPSAFRSGEITDVDGTVLGVHNGIANYTIGQRKGLGIAVGEPLYVTRIDAENNRVIVGKADEVLCDHIVAKDLIFHTPLESPEEYLTVKVRHGMSPAKARVRLEPYHFDDSCEENHCIEACNTKTYMRLVCDLDEAIAGVAPGQSLVCYRGNITVCGGIIT